MFDISALKEMKLPELQEIAKLAKTIKFAGVKKEKLIDEILKHQASQTAKKSPEPEAQSNGAEQNKPKRARISADKKNEAPTQTLFSEPDAATPVPREAVYTQERPEPVLEG